MLELTNDQKHALEMLENWAKKPEKQFIALGGYAGTGKTLLLSIFRQKLFDENPKLKVAFCSFTGKAAQVLKYTLASQKALYKEDSVSTIHALIYQAIDDEYGRVMGWKKREGLETDLIIVDEASMVSQLIWNDLQSFGLPIIVAGDHGQLPPVGESFSLMDCLDIRLEQIHRQAQDSPIIKLSMLAREHGYIPVGRYSPYVKKYSRQDPDINSITQELLEQWNEDTLFLVGRNKTRVKLNAEIRAIREVYNESTQPKDRVICVKNNWKTGIFNGMLGTIERIKPLTDGRGKVHWYKTEIMMDDGTFYDGKISVHQFNNDTVLREVPGLDFWKAGDLFDFGYALTVHKAQGSQANKVVVFEERNQHQSDEDWKRWLYTAVTRAEKELVVIGE